MSAQGMRKQGNLIQYKSDAATVKALHCAPSWVHSGFALDRSWPAADLPVIPEDVDADDGLLEGGVRGLHQVIIYVLRVAQGVQALHDLHCQEYAVGQVPQRRQQRGHWKRYGVPCST